MFVRSKTIKNKPYAYLVDNSWKKGKVKQSVKKYLGPIISLEQPFENHSALYFDLDTSQSSRACLRDCIAREFLACGFSQEKNVLKKDSFSINLVTGHIRKGSKPIVFLVNGRYLYDGLLKFLLSFSNPETDEEVPGKRLAQAFSDAGIRIDQQVFVELYKKLYS
mgnify:CR=1 FL=1